MNTPTKDQPFTITLENLDKMQRIAHVSAQAAGKDVWTELGIYYRPSRARPFVCVVIGAVAAGHPRGFVPRLTWQAFGTLDRACGWFEPSELRDRLLAEVPDDARVLYPDSSEIAQAEAAERRAIREAVNGAITDGVLRGPAEVAQAAVPHLRLVGYYDGTLAGVLRWLYPDAASDAALSLSVERDFDMPARTVRRALQIEAAAEPTPGQHPAGMGAWVGIFVQAMRCFDRELWYAGVQATAARADR